jgi:hypothetical protein
VANQQNVADIYAQASKQLYEALLIDGQKRADSMEKVIKTLKYIPKFDSVSNVNKLPFYGLSGLANCFMNKWGDAKNLNEKALKISPDDYLATVTAAILAYRTLLTNLLPSAEQKMAPITTSLAAVNAFQMKYRGATPTSPNVNRDRFLMMCLAMMAENYYASKNTRSVLFVLVYTPFGDNDRMTREELVTVLQTVQGFKTVLESIKEDLVSAATPEKK